MNTTITPDIGASVPEIGEQAERGSEPAFSSTGIMSGTASSSPIPLAQHIPTLLFVSVTVLTSTLITRTQPVPYIDEIFHIPQAQRLCSALLPSNKSPVNGLWQRLRAVEYDPKLTTPPGLYAISVGLAKVLPGWQCGDVAWLRSTNLVLLLTMPVLVARILRQNDERLGGEAASQTTPRPLQQRSLASTKTSTIPRALIKDLQAKAASETPPSPAASQESLPDIDPSTISVTRTAPPPADLPRAPKRKEATPYTMALACTICFLPPLWFFGFLYYTDVASVWLTLACWTLYNDLATAPRLRTGTLIAAISTLAVLVRQTNIVWVGFCAAQALLARTPMKGTGLVAEVSGVVTAAVGRRRGEFWRSTAVMAAPMLPMLVGCAAFIAWNGSIVLGDKSNHQAGVHLPQMGYFLAFATGFGLFPLLHSLTPKHTRAQSGSLARSVVSPAAVVAKAALGSPTGFLTLAASFAAFYIAVDRFTIDHPFLLADNRHYTFYLWRRFRRTYALPFLQVQPRYAMIPLYSLALVAWSTALRTAGPGALGSVLVWMATAATLVPTPLVEPRYFLIAYVVLRISCQPRGGGEGRTRWVYLVAEAAGYALVNAVTVGLFVRRPFEWAPEAVDRGRGEGTTMRFIW